MEHLYKYAKIKGYWLEQKNTQNRQRAEIDQGKYGQQNHIPSHFP